MFAMICTDNLRYKKTKYYDSEYVIKGTLHINEHAYAFSHYDGAFEVLGIRWLSNCTKGFFGPEICNVEGKDIQTAWSIINSIMGERQARFYSAKLNDEVYDTQYAVSEYAAENWADDIVPPVVINSCIWAIAANTAAEMQKDNRFLRRKEICDTEFLEIAARIYNELLGFAARKYEILDIGE